MKINKGLAGIVFATGLALSGCSKTCYDLPNEERVCIEKGIGGDRLMIITKTDGRIIEIDYFRYDNGEVEAHGEVKITKDKKTEKYTEPAILEEANNIIRKYYIMAIKDKTEKALKDLQ